MKGHNVCFYAELQKIIPNYLHYPSGSCVEHSVQFPDGCLALSVYITISFVVFTGDVH